MNTPPLPPNHELLPPDFLRQHGAVKGMLCKGTNSDACQWTEYARMATVSLSVFIESGCVFSAPLGTIAAATTPVPEGRCTCGLATLDLRTFRNPQHALTCSRHPRNAYVHILPHQLAQLPEKPEGLMWACAEREDTWEECIADWPLRRVEDSPSCFAYCVPRHVMDRIEKQQIETLSDWKWSSGKPAAPESSVPTGEAAPSDTEMLDWLEKQAKASSTGISFDWCRYAEEGYVVEHGFRFMRRHFLGERKSALRSAISAAMKEDRK